MKLKQEVNGILVPKNDLEAFTKAITFLINNENDLVSYGQNGLKLLDQFSNEQIILNWFDLLSLTKN